MHFNWLLVVASHGLPANRISRGGGEVFGVAYSGPAPRGRSHKGVGHGGVACDGQPALPPSAPSPTEDPALAPPPPVLEPAARWRPMGGSCASQIDFLGAEFTPAAAVAFRTRGALEPGAALQRELRRADPKPALATPHLPSRRWSNLGICIPRPGLRGSPSLLFSPAHARG